MPTTTQHETITQAGTEYKLAPVTREEIDAIIAAPGGGYLAFNFGGSVWRIARYRADDTLIGLARRPVPKPEPFAKRFDLYRHLASHTLLVHLASNQVATVDSGLWRWHNGDEEVQKEPGAETYQFWRPYCPVWDAPEPTVEEEHAADVKEFKAGMSDYLESWGLTWSTASNGFSTHHRGCPSAYAGCPGVAYSIDLTNCHKPEGK